MKEGQKNKGGRPARSATPDAIIAEIAEVDVAIEILRKERAFMTDRITDLRTRKRRLFERIGK